MKKNNQGTSSKIQTQNNSWWHTILVLWLFWLLSSQRATRVTSQPLSHFLLLLSFSNLLSEANSQVLQEPFPAVFELSKLDGSNGYKLQGISAGDFSGASVSAAGDVNGDGIGDVIIGASGASPNGKTNAGESYVVFGSKIAFNASFSLASLDGTNGFKLEGVNKGEGSGVSVAAVGDFNGDRIDDIIIGTPTANYIYIVYGSQSRFNASMSLEDLNGQNDLKLVTSETPSSYVGTFAGAGDVNGDGFDDVIIGIPSASPNGTSSAGECYVIFGSKSGFNATFSVASLNGENGFRLQGTNVNDAIGTSVAGAGDFNGDGFDDVIIAVHNSLQLIVVLGSNSKFNATLPLASLNGMNGFTIKGINTLYGIDIVASAGDINGDGVDDVIIGAPYITRNGNKKVGEAYIIFGSKSKFNPTLLLSSLNGTNGFKFEGAHAYDECGGLVANVGDINGDGIDDVIINTTGVIDGESYVVFGSKYGFNATISPPSLNGENGFTIKGITRVDGWIAAVAGAGDVNGDGIVDAILSSTEIGQYTGESYIIFGHSITRMIRLDKNQFIIEQPGVTKTLSPLELAISYQPGSLALLSRLNITISDVQHGEFKINTVSQPSPFTFKHTLLSNQSVTFTHDGSDELPSYKVIVTDGRAKVGPSPIIAFIQFKNQLVLTQDELLTLNSSMINAKMTGRSMDEVAYVITKPNRLDFKNSQNNIVTRFTQAEVSAGTIRLISSSPSNANAEYRPSFEFQIEVNNTDILPQPLRGNVTYYLQPAITANALNILMEGEQIAFGPQQLAVSYGQDSGDDLTIMINNVIGGIFRLNNITQTPPFQFKARVIRQNALSFTQDGTDTLPAYEVSVTDGRRIAGPTRASVTAPFAKQQPPQVINNQLSLNEGERKVLTRNNLLAVDDTITNPGLIRYLLIRSSLSHIQFNQLLLNRTSIEEFNQKEINDAAIEVVHDGEDAAPSASFQVSDGELTGMTTSFNITFLANQPDAPVLKLNEVLIKQGDVIAVTTDWLTASDSDAGDTEKLIIKVITSTHGYFRKVGEDVALQEFTRSDVVANHIEFVHDGSSVAPDIKLQVSDGMLTSDEQTLAVKFAETGNSNGVAIGIGTAIGILSCAGLFAGGYAFYRKRQADLSREGNELDVRVSRIVYERLNIKGVANFNSGPGLKYVAQISEINQAYQRVNGEISDVRSYSEALAQAIKAVFSADADVISKGNSLSFNIADENKRQPLRRQCEAIVERCRNSVNGGNQVLSTNSRNDVPLKTF